MTARQDMRIVHLVDVPEASPTLVQWFVEEWAPWYGPDGQGDAEADFAACRDALPICLVALDGEGGVLGTASLKAESVGAEPAPGPWLAAMLVGKAHQGRGIGTALGPPPSRRSHGGWVSPRSTPRPTRPRASWNAGAGKGSGPPNPCGAT